MQLALTWKLWWVIKAQTLLQPTRTWVLLSLNQFIKVLWLFSCFIILAAIETLIPLAMGTAEYAEKIVYLAQLWCMQSFHSVYVPSVLFYSFICKCSCVFLNLFNLKKACNLFDIQHNVVDTVTKTVPAPSKCIELDISKLLTSFINVMIFYKVRFFNRDVKKKF